MPRLPESEEQLDILLLTISDHRSVRTDGIRFNTYRYFDIELRNYQGQEVTIRYDPRDMSRILVFQGNARICTADCEELRGKTVSYSDVIHTRKSRRKELRDKIQAKVKAANKLMVPAYVKEVAELLDPAPSSKSAKPKLKRFINED